MHIVIVRVERLVFGGCCHRRGDAGSPGSGGASPYQRRDFPLDADSIS